MLLYRYTKLMEEHTRNKTLNPERAGNADAEFAELLQIRDQMSEAPACHEEDCSDWGTEATY